MPKGRSRSQRTRRRGLRASAPEYIPMARRGRRSSGGINSLLREINTRRRRSLGEGRNSGSINSMLREINTRRRRSLGERRRSR